MVFMTEKILFFSCPYVKFITQTHILILSSPDTFPVTQILLSEVTMRDPGSVPFLPTQVTSFSLVDLTPISPSLSFSFFSPPFTPPFFLLSLPIFNPSGCLYIQSISRIQPVLATSTSATWSQPPMASLPPLLIPSAWSSQSSQRVLLRYKSLLKALGGSHLTQSESQRPCLGLQGPTHLSSRPSDLTSHYSPGQAHWPPSCSYLATHLHPRPFALAVSAP